MSSKNKKYTWITKELLYDLYWNQNKDSVEIAKLLDVSQATISKYMINFDIPRRSFSESQKLNNIEKLKYWQNKEWLYNEYIINNKSSYTIAKEVNSVASTVFRWIKIFNISTRNKSESQIGKKISDVARQKMSKAKIGKKISPKCAEKLRESLIGRTLSEETRRKISQSLKGPNHPLWKGGEYQHKYCFKFNNKLKEEIRNKFNRRCYLCDRNESTKRRLGIHHIDYDKLQGCKGKKWALIPLCESCHCKTLSNKHHWFNLFINYWVINSEINFNAYSTAYSAD